MEWTDDNLTWVAVPLRLHMGIVALHVSMTLPSGKTIAGTAHWVVDNDNHFYLTTMKAINAMLDEIEA